MPTKLRWRRDIDLNSRGTFVTDRDLLDFKETSNGKYPLYGLLIESQAIISNVYNSVAEFSNNYDLIFTHSSQILNSSPNSRWIPGGGVWIGGSYSGGQIGILEKTKNVSFLSSNKLQCRLHRKRFLTALALNFTRSDVDVYLQLPGSSKRINIQETLNDYRYTIIFENFIDDSYFTEKILNAFATGTIPIYFGARDIGNYFNELGIIPFNSLGQLRHIISTIVSPRDYAARIEAVRDNFERVQAYKSLEDFIVQNYLE